MFTPNIEKQGRICRFIVALCLLALAYYFQSFLLLFAALFVFFEVIKGWCLFYALIGKNNCPR